MARILITGGAGFIGSQLGYRLHNEGHEVILVDNMSYGNEDNLIVDGKTFGSFVELDVRNDTIFDVMKDVDYVYHFAGIASLPDCQENPYNTIDNNVAGTANVLEAARINNVKRFIFSSTSAVYENNYIYPVKEPTFVFPNLLYSVSKKQSELLCTSFTEIYNMPIVMLRFFNVYGPHQDFKRKHPPLINYMIQKLLNNEVPTFYGDGNQKRDYVYVDDVIDMCKLVINLDGAVGHTFNVSSGKVYSVNELYKIVSELIGVEITPTFNKAETFWDKYESLFSGDYKFNRARIIKEVNKYCCGSTDKARITLGWTAKTDIRVGLGDCVNYVKNNLSN